METTYETYEQQAADYVNRYQPSKTKTFCCCSSRITLTLAARFFIRTAIPILFGLLFGSLVEAGERNLGMHNDDAILEVSDFIGCAITLLVTNAINTLLNCCWRANPYNKYDFFRSPTPKNSPTTALLKGPTYNA